VLNISLFETIKHTFEYEGGDGTVSCDVEIDVERPAVPLALRIGDKMSKTMREHGVSDEDLENQDLSVFVAFADAQESIYDMVLPLILDVRGFKVEGKEWKELSREWKLKLFMIQPSAVFLPVYHFVMDRPSEKDREPLGGQDSTQLEESDPRPQ
jgi:hypothetical protein